MNNVFYLFLRRMRLPFILILLVLAVTVAGLAVIPGVDAAGNPTPGMGMFNAFYVMTYTSTTIGFGELPAPYSTAQRMWMTFSMYLSVVGWSYSVFSVIALVQDPQFQGAVQSSIFARRIRRLSEPFYIVCGFGETGALVCHGLDRLGFRFVVIDSSPERLQRLWLEEYRSDTPTSMGDASEPATLTDAGLLSPYCRGVLALAADDDTNRSIAVTVRLLAPDVPVLARVSQPTQDLNMGAFGGDFIVNPFERFAQYLVEAVSAPEAFHLRQVLNGLPGDEMPTRHHPPHGNWIMCGYGRFGHRIREQLERAGQRVTVIDRLHFGEPGVDFLGSGTDAAGLVQAGIENAVGIVAGNANDLKNLAIAVVARDLKPDIFIVTRQNQLSNRTLFDAFADDLAMEPSRIVAHEFLAVITTPLLARFADLVPALQEARCVELADQLGALDHGRVPEVWSVTIDAAHAEAVTETVASGRWVTVKHLLTDPFERDLRLSAMVLMVSRDGANLPLPEADFQLAVGDEVLLAGSPEAMHRMPLVLRNRLVLDFIRTGREGSGSWLWSALREQSRKWRRARIRRGG